MTEGATDPVSPAPYFTGGEWTFRDDIVAHAWHPGDRDVEDVLESLGYSKWAQLGDPDALAVPLTLTIYTRGQPPRFFLNVEGNQHSTIEHVYAEALPDLMELLARWTPAIRAAAVTEVCWQLAGGTTQEWEDRTASKPRKVVELLEALAGRGDR